MAWTAINYTFSLDVILLYASAIFWTLGYDTIYGAQDMSDDEIIGLKSTAIKFKKKIKLFISICYFISTFLILLLFYDFLGLNVFTIFLFFFLSTLFYQIKNLKMNNSKNYLKLFKINNYSGLFLFLGINFINY